MSHLTNLKLKQCIKIVCNDYRMYLGQYVYVY